MRKYSEDEIFYIKNHYGKVKTKRIAEKIGITSNQMIAIVKKLGLKHPKVKKEWTKEELEFLVNNYKLYTVKQMSVELGRTVVAIQNKIKEVRKESGMSLRRNFNKIASVGDSEGDK